LQDEDVAFMLGFSGTIRGGWKFLGVGWACLLLLLSLEHLGTKGTSTQHLKQPHILSIFLKNLP